MASAAGGTSQRLKPGPAIVRSRSSQPRCPLPDAPMLASLMTITPKMHTVLSVRTALTRCAAATSVCADERPMIRRFAPAVAHPAAHPGGNDKVQPAWGARSTAAALWQESYDQFAEHDWEPSLAHTGCDHWSRSCRPAARAAP